MCGIGLIHIRDMERGAGIDMDACLDALLTDLEWRGRDATGYAAITSGGFVQTQKASCEARTFIRHRHLLPVDTRTVIAHTRFATQGHHAFPENNHPVRRGHFYVVHNGHVVNDDALFVKAQRERFGEVDSEAIAAILAHHGSIDRARKAMAAVEGDAAIAALDDRHPADALLARGEGSPLYVLTTRRVIIAASSEDACEEAHRRGIGSLGRARARRIPEGTIIRIHNGTQTRDTYAVPFRRALGWHGWDTDPKQTTTTTTTALGDKLAAALTPERNLRRCDLCGTLTDTTPHAYANDPTDQYDVCDDCTDDWHRYMT